MHLVIIRHGQTAWNVENLAQGHTDIALDATGHQQARSLLEAQFSQVPEVIYASDLQRALQTAHPLAERWGIPVVAEPRLRERSMGEWEGWDFRTVHEEFESRREPDDPLALRVQPPGGESVMQVWERLNPWVKNLVAESKPAIVVSHGAACALVLGQLLQTTPEVARSFRFANASVTELRRTSANRFALLKYDCTRHLEALAAPLTGSLDGNERIR